EDKKEKQPIKEKNEIQENSKTKTDMFSFNINKHEFFVKNGWKDFFLSQKNDLEDMFKEIYRNDEIVYPPTEDIFKVFELIDLKNIKVILIGQDPYHEYNQAMGLAFSVRKGIKVPPSLVNIFKEVENCGFTIKDKTNGDLTSWCNQGVFLIN